MLRVSRIHYPVTALGPGRRLGVWVQGCPLACRGCMSRDTWSADGGTEVAVEELVAAWRDAVVDGAEGLTVSGGEPLAQPAAVAGFLAAAGEIGAAAGRELDILLYTGYERDELGAAERAVVELADAVVTGRFDVARPTDLIWRGSANQQLTPLTRLGWSRYGPYLDHVPDRTPMQFAVDDRDIRFIGVPRRGDLARLERAMARRGVHLEGLTWRP